MANQGLQNQRMPPRPPRDWSEPLTEERSSQFMVKFASQSIATDEDDEVSFQQPGC